MSDGERHNIDLEWRKRLIRRLAGRLNVLMHKQDVERCFLAASREINRQLVDELDAACRLKIEKNIVADLTKLEKSDLLRHLNTPRSERALETRPAL